MFEKHIIPAWAKKLNDTIYNGLSGKEKEQWEADFSAAMSGYKVEEGSCQKCRDLIISDMLDLPAAEHLDEKKVQEISDRSKRSFDGAAAYAAKKITKSLMSSFPRCNTSLNDYGPSMHSPDAIIASNLLLKDISEIFLRRLSEMPKRQLQKMNEYQLIKELCGLSHSEAAVFHRVSLDTAKSWASGRRNAPTGAINELKSLWRDIKDGKVNNMPFDSCIDRLNALVFASS